LDGTLGQARYYSLHANRLYLWPSGFDAVQSLHVTGYRKPVDFLTADAGAAPDCDERLHLSLIWYGCALAQAANEDEVLDSLYYKKWQQGVETARSDIMRPDPGRARILNGGLFKLSGRFKSWRY
jgi:hypothetical protein